MNVIVFNLKFSNCYLTETQRLYPSTLLSQTPSFYCLTMRIDSVLQLMRQYSALTVENFYLSLEAEYDSCPDSVKQ